MTYGLCLFDARVYVLCALLLLFNKWSIEREHGQLIIYHKSKQNFDLNVRTQLTERCLMCKLEIQSNAIFWHLCHMEMFISLANECQNE